MSKSSRNSRFSQPRDELEQVTPSVVRRATGRKGKGMQAGQFIRRQFTFYPETLKDIEAFAEELGVAEAEMARWCIERGLKALHEGERPLTVSIAKVALVRPTQVP
jgi:hypothetical protein